MGTEPSSDFEPADPAYASRVRASFARQGLMCTLGAELVRVGPGTCEIRLPFREGLSQQHGFFHAGATAAIADSAGGYAALSLMGADDSVLSVEYKINLLAPAQGDLLIARARVIRAGRTLTVCRADVAVRRGGVETECATMQQTVIRLAGRPDEPPGAGAAGPERRRARPEAPSAYCGRAGAGTVAARRRLRPAETRPRTRNVKAPRPAPIACALSSRSLVYRITAGRLTSACGCPLCERNPASLYQPSAGGATTEATTAPRIAPSRTKISTVLVTKPPLAEEPAAFAHPMPAPTRMHPASPPGEAR